jgi:hypothetical protein
LKFGATAFRASAPTPIDLSTKYAKILDNAARRCAFAHGSNGAGRRSAEARRHLHVAR